MLTSSESALKTGNVMAGGDNLIGITIIKMDDKGLSMAIEKVIDFMRLSALSQSSGKHSKTFVAVKYFHIINKVW